MEKKVCKACRHGTCADCIRYLWHGLGCDHDCEAMRQLTLPVDQEVEHGALQARGQRDDTG